MAGTDDGDINLNFNVDGADAIANVDKIAAALEQLQAKYAQAGASISSAGKQADAAATSYSRLADSMNTLAAASGTAAPATAKAAEGIGAVGRAAGSSHGQVSTMVRELVTMGREASRGNFTRLAGSATIFGSALASLSIPVAASIGAIAALGAAVVGVAYEMEQGRQKIEQFRDAMAATNGAAGITGSEYLQMAGDVHKATGASTGDIQALELQAIRSGKVGGENIGLMTKAAIELARGLGEKPPAVMEQLIGLTDDVAGSAVKLNARFNNLDEGTLKLITDHQRLGDMDGAVAIELESLSKKAEEQTGKVNGLAQAWDGLTQRLQRNGRIGTPEATDDDKIKNAQQALAYLNSQRGLTMGDGRKAIDQEIAQQQQIINQAKAHEKIEGDIAAHKRAQAQAEGALAAADANLLPNAKERRDLEQQIATLQSGIDNGLYSPDEKKHAQSDIAELQKRKDSLKDQWGAKPPKPPVLADDRAALEQQLADQQAYGDKALDLEKTYWEGVARTAKAGTTEAATAVSELGRIKLEQGQRAIEMQYTVDHDAAESAEQKARSGMEAAQREVDAKIDAKKSEMEQLQQWDGKELADLNALYQKRLDATLAWLAKIHAAQDAADDAEIAKADRLGDTVGAQAARDKKGQDDDQYNSDVAAAQDNTGLDVQKANDTATDKATDAARKATQQQVAMYRSMYMEIGDAARTTFEGLIEHTMTWRQAVTKIEESVLDSFLRTQERSLAKELATQQAGAAGHVGANAIKTASDESTAATAKSLSLQQFIANANNEAVASAQAAYASTMKFIPAPFNLVAAPAAAATAYAATLALGVFSAEGGWDRVPYDGARAILHKNEMVMSAPLADKIRALTDNAGNLGVPAHMQGSLRDLLGKQQSGGVSTNNSRSFTNSGGIHFHQAPGQNSRDFARDVQAALFEGKRRNMYDPRMLGLA